MWAIFVTPADRPSSCFQTDNDYDIWLMIANSQDMLGMERPKGSQPLLHVEPRLLSHCSAFPHTHPQVLLVKPGIFRQLFFLLFSVNLKICYMYSTSQIWPSAIPAALCQQRQYQLNKPETCVASGKNCPSSTTSTLVLVLIRLQTKATTPVLPTSRFT